MTHTTTLPPWRRVWRQGIQPQLPSRGLLLLLEALASDDPRLAQRITTIPPCQVPATDDKCEAACPIGFAWWKGANLYTIDGVEDAFAACCAECDRLCARFEPASSRLFIDWWDSTPRLEARRELLAEVHEELVRRRIWRWDQPAPKLKEEE